MTWPASFTQLAHLQESLAGKVSGPFQALTGDEAVGGVFACFTRGTGGIGQEGDTGWAGAALAQDGHVTAGVAVTGKAGGVYRSGYLAVREGALLEAAVRALVELPAVLIVNATGPDHPRRAGLALHLGEVLGIPTIGVTHRPLLATGDWPQSEEEGATSELLWRDEVVGHWVRTRAGCRPVAVHAGWRVDARTARTVVLATARGNRTPEPLREARRLARTARSEARTPPGSPRVLKPGKHGQGES